MKRVNEGTSTVTPERARQDAVVLNDHALKLWIRWLVGRLKEAKKPDSHIAYMVPTIEVRLKGALEVQTERIKASAKLQKTIKEVLMKSKSPTNENRAGQRVGKELAKINELIRKIQKELKSYEKQKTTEDWGYVGNLEHVFSSLKDIHGFLTNYK